MGADHKSPLIHSGQVLFFVQVEGEFTFQARIDRYFVDQDLTKDVIISINRFPGF
jgi:hypothetical protein